MNVIQDFKKIESGLGFALGVVALLVTLSAQANNDGMDCNPNEPERVAKMLCEESGGSLKQEERYEPNAETGKMDSIFSCQIMINKKSQIREITVVRLEGCSVKASF